MENTINKISQKKAIEILNVSRITLYEWAKQGRIKKFKIGRKNYYDIDSINAAFQEQKY